MRKSLIFVLIIALLCPAGASAAERPKYLALIFNGCPRDPEELLRGLEARGVRVTFFLEEKDAPRAENFRVRGHEAGILTDMGPELSRREIAGVLKDREQQMNGRIRLLWAAAGRSDGLRQVAGALGFSFVLPSGALHPLTPAKDGEVLAVDRKMSTVSLLELVDDLQSQGFVFVTVPELARIRGISLRPGELYRNFPPREVM